MSRRRRWSLVACALALVVLTTGAALHLTGWSSVVRGAILGKKTVADRIAEFGPTARARLAPHFASAGVWYPPARLMLVGFKSEKRLDVYATGADGAARFIRSYPILAASGRTGPKLKRGDRQVPEGIYAIESLNPNSRFHLALRVGYPNAFDREMAARDGRTDLGSDIMIHGKSASIGCLAMGDEAAEELFILAAETGIENIKVILAPIDLRASPPSHHSNLPDWTTRLYEQIVSELSRLPVPPPQAQAR
ncbi:MAG: L,D-transpeptidase family protein [Tepidisphaeraceae bacterium]